MADPHVAGTLALLAIVDKPVAAAEVYTLSDQVVNAVNLGWTDAAGGSSSLPSL
jgi:hypothetical protein